jgi:ubiquinone/menaquinone biosynthesis C-methylase UbiE
MMDQGSHNVFEEKYLLLRQKEGRIYTDVEVRLLPQVASHHPLKKEWEVRRFSCHRVLAYLKTKNRPLHILEVGCGNGWLSNRLSSIAGTSVVGIDINQMELGQAKRVFRKPNLEFRIGDLESCISEKFDVILFAASMQYFPSVREALNNGFARLNEDGEILILDTYFYNSRERDAASARSSAYFSSAGFEEMSRFYFHHSLEKLDGMKYKLLYNPDRVINRVLKQSPFPLIAIKKC